MGAPVELTLVILLPTALGYVAIAGIRALRWAAERRSHPPAAEPIDRLGARLRRLRAELETVETRGGLTAKGLRLRALRAAYADALDTACHRLAVRPPGGPGERPQGAGAVATQIPLAEIYRVEAELRERGLDVRGHAAGASPAGSRRAR